MSTAPPPDKEPFFFVQIRDRAGRMIFAGSVDPARHDWLGIYETEDVTTVELKATSLISLLPLPDGHRDLVALVRTEETRHD